MNATFGAAIAPPHLLPASLLDDIIDSVMAGEPLCCLARPGAGAAALLQDLTQQLCGERRLVRCSLAQCHDVADAVAAITLAAMQAGVPEAGAACGLDAQEPAEAPLQAGAVSAMLRAKLARASWRQAMPDLLQHLAGSPTLLVLEGMNSFFVNWQGNVAFGQDSMRRTELRIVFTMLAEAASETLGLVVLATPGFATLLKAHSASDVLGQCNELPLGLPESEAPVTPEAAAEYLITTGAEIGLCVANDAAAAVVEAVGTEFPEHLALVMEHAAAAAAQEKRAEISAQFVQDVVLPRCIGPFEPLRWRRQEQGFFEGADEAHLPLLLTLLYDAASNDLSFDTAMKTAGMASGHAPMPVAMLRTYLEWLELEGFLVRRGSFYRLPHSLFGRWLAARYSACVLA